MFAITERLLLRPGWAEDAPVLAAAIGEAAIARNLARVPYPYAESDAAAFLALPQEPGRPRFLIFLRDGATLIGGIALDGESEGDANLGYWIARAYWGQGFATEAGRAVCALADASLRLPRLRASHSLDNPASGRVLGKLGFRPGLQARLHSLGRGETLEVHQFTRDRVEPAAPALAA
ncbi:GNAT family N-acetyltransferase [Sphingomonas nostoxanthinifaciens]|uniref:GNAT family N-acetyltransferase n=1 Tax=Sphingomonas nostoxanthinifaciens TaxID=2872652 RepID=UPI001CC20166|nr:GNAT family N-acetyltransferase [Sphingomonas nostoxanthinifaciens]UAK24231.1 GNAT family N-acetyltransferase [Sphingomonas nostoxanthinifaciens]